MLPYAIKLVDTHISNLRIGDTVIYAGHMRTLTKSNLSRGFMGRTLYGDSHKLGLVSVKLVLFPRFQRGNYVGHYPK